MPKSPTFPTCLDEVKKITLGDLRQLGHLRQHWATRGSLSWSRCGKPSGSVTVAADANNQFIELSYKSNGRPINYRVYLESRPSNLGIGEVLYFICPATRKRCRTLYEHGDYFYSRHAFRDAMYSSQTESKLTRGWLQGMRTLTLRDDFLSKPYSRTHYNGKITRRYQKILDRMNGFNPNAIRQAIDRLHSTRT